MDERRPTVDGSKSQAPHSFIKRMIEMWKYFMIMFAYLWLLFGLFVLNQQVAYQQQGSPYFYHGFAVLNALVLAKVMLIFEELRLSRGLQRSPLFVTIVFEAALCALLFVGFHIVERYIVALFHGQPLSGVQVGPGGPGFNGLLIVSLILFISLIPFFAFKNITRVIGRDRMMGLLFRAPGNDGR